MLHQADRLGPGANGRTTYRLTETLGAGGTYHWRVRAFDGANTGPYSAPSSFTMTEPVIIDAPMPLAPLGQISTMAPVFKMTNGRIAGPAGPVIYRVEVGVARSRADRRRAQCRCRLRGTTSLSGGNAPYATTLYWRAYATNGAVESGVLAVGGVPYARRAHDRRRRIGATARRRRTGRCDALNDINEAAAIVRGVHDGTGANLGSRSSRDSRNAFSASAVAAVHYGHTRFNPRGPDPDWCIKDGGAGRPQSDDVIVRCDSRDAWDMVGGAGANGYSFHIDYIGRLPGEQNVYPPPRSALPR